MYGRPPSIKEIRPSWLRTPIASAVLQASDAALNSTPSPTSPGDTSAAAVPGAEHPQQIRSALQQESAWAAPGPQAEAAPGEGLPRDTAPSAAGGADARSSQNALLRSGGSAEEVPVVWGAGPPVCSSADAGSPVAEGAEESASTAGSDSGMPPRRRCSSGTHAVRSSDLWLPACCLCRPLMCGKAAADGIVVVRHAPSPTRPPSAASGMHACMASRMWGGPVLGIFGDLLEQDLDRVEQNPATQACNLICRGRTRK